MVAQLEGDAELTDGDRQALLAEKLKLGNNTKGRAARFRVYIITSEYERSDFNIEWRPGRPDAGQFMCNAGCSALGLLDLLSERVAGTVDSGSRRLQRRCAVA